MDLLIRKEWTVDDLIEAVVDEVSTAGNVGSGTDRKVGSSVRWRFSEDLEKILREFEDYLKKTGKEASVAEARAFAAARHLPESLALKFINKVRG